MNFTLFFMNIAVTLLFLACGGVLAGYPLTRYLDVNPRHRLLLAAPIGLALIGVISLPIFMYLSFTPMAVLISALLISAGSWIAGRWIRTSASMTAPCLSISWILIASILSLVPAYSVSPHFFYGGITFGAPIFDHEKVVIIDEMLRNGTPPRNPFFSKHDVSPLLSYYYGWYFLAAQAALLSGATGWPADIAFTFLTAFISLTFMGWGALRFSGRMAAAWAVLPLSVASSLLPIGVLLFGPRAEKIVMPEHGLETWIVQSAWVPQHLFGAVLACLAVLCFVRVLESRSIDLMLCIMIGVLTSFAYDASVWVGIAGLVPVLITVTVSAFRRENLKLYIEHILLSGLFSLIGVVSLVFQEAHRIGNGKVIDWWVFPVVTKHNNIFGNFENIITYWFYLVIIYFGILYIPVIIWIFQKFRAQQAWTLMEKAMLATCLVPLLMAEFLHSVIATNDLGWRCVLISVLAMTIIAARVLTEQFRRVGIIIVGIFLFVPAFISGIVFIFQITVTQKLHGNPSADAIRFRKIDPILWQAVASVTPAKEAVANNPFYEASLTPWEGDIAWAMLSNRESCTPPYSYLAAFASNETKNQIFEQYDTIRRVFDGIPSSADFKLLRDEYECRTLLVVPSDALWKLPKTTPSPYFQLIVENPREWRIYRASP
ncbi:hypothetical protein ACU81Q_10495 [Komagataeibacter melomenusus]